MLTNRSFKMQHDGKQPHLTIAHAPVRTRAA